MFLLLVDVLQFISRSFIINGALLSLWGTARVQLDLRTVQVLLVDAGTAPVLGTRSEVPTRKTFPVSLYTTTRGGEERKRGREKKRVNIHIHLIKIHMYMYIIRGGRRREVQCTYTPYGIP